MAVVNGSTALAALAVRLKATGSGGLRVELLRGLKAQAAPAVDAVRAAARNQLPKSGGLAERVASSPIKVQVRTGARTAGVRIVTTEHDTRPTNYGQVRHPVFGHMDRWVPQDIPNAAGWFTDTLARRENNVTGELLRVMVQISAAIQRGL